MELEVDLDERYRPTTLDDVCGQPEAIAVVKSWGQNIPRAIMFHGGPGQGKTSIARVIAHDVLGIDKIDYQEVNCGAVKSAIDMVRDLTQAVTSMPAVGAKKMWTLDEAQVFSRSKGAAEALLKVLEDAKPHVVFSLCTTEPQRLLPAIRSRCVSVGLRALTLDELTGLITDENAEGIRQMLLAAARTTLLRGKPGQSNAEHAANVITELGMPYHDAGSSHAILAKDCWNIVKLANRK
jgi:DNA polymerase III gamma/tau subunit